LVEQAARLLRQTQGRKDELVALITSAEPSRLNAQDWLRLNRQAWDIESGLHQRLDVSQNDDRCRVRNDNGLWVLGMMRRLSNSLFMEWRQLKRRPHHVTTTDFQSALSEEHHRPALRLVLSRRPRLECLS
jgi:predicted transposase YbfD/YdcC